jgi:hypothetical protein
MVRSPDCFASFHFVQPLAELPETTEIYVIDLPRSPVLWSHRSHRGSKGEEVSNFWVLTDGQDRENPHEDAEESKRRKRHGGLERASVDGHVDPERD